jgi:hypothetical protein
MQRFQFRALLATLLAPAALFAQNVTTSGTLSVAGGGALLDGDRPAFQELTQNKKDAYGGLEEFRLVREDETSILKLDARFLLGNDNYRLAFRYDQMDRYYVDAGYDQFRVYYDGSSARFLPTDQSFVMFDEDLSLKRSKIWAEVGVYTANMTLIKLRYDRAMRDGTKSSTMWADSNLVGAPYGTRSFIPSYYDLDESTDIISLDVGNLSQEEVKWNVGARYQETKLDNARWSRRRAFEAADRQVTTKDQTTTDIFTMHGYYLRKLNEQFTVSGGALRTTLDSNLGGSRIYGQSFDPVYDPAYARKQQRDEGFYNLTGDAQIKQTVLNLNAVYTPKQHWTVRSSIRFENRHNESMAEFIETNIVGSALVAEAHDMVSAHDKKWDEFAESIDVRFTGIPNWRFSARGDWVQGSGDLEEEFYDHHTHAFTVDRKSDDSRRTQKYTLNANWYAQPGLSFSAQYYFKGQVNDYDIVRDNTDNTSGNRYPSYLTDQDFETHDINFRMSWRPASTLNLVSRYDHQQSKIFTQGVGLQMITSSKVTSHILSQSATWSPTSRLYLSGSVNVTYDQMETPALAFVQNGDNNYLNGTLSAGYTIGNQDDLRLDYSYFKADNFIDRSFQTMPHGNSQKTQAAYLTWVRRQTETLVYTMRYGYLTNRDITNRGLNDFDAHVIYARIQFLF